VEELAGIFNQAGKEETVLAIILRSKGDKVFSAEPLSMRCWNRRFRNRKKILSWFCKINLVDAELS